MYDTIRTPEGEELIPITFRCEYFTHSKK